MKKVLLVLALVAAYGVSIAMNSSNVVTVDDVNKTTVVADVNEKAPNAEKEKGEKAKTKEAKADGKAEGCADSKAKAEGCADSKAKAEGCSGKAKSDCSSSCSGEKKK